MTFLFINFICDVVSPRLLAKSLFTDIGYRLLLLKLPV